MDCTECKHCASTQATYSCEEKQHKQMLHRKAFMWHESHLHHSHTCSEAHSVRLLHKTASPKRQTKLWGAHRKETCIWRASRLGHMHPEAHTRALAHAHISGACDVDADTEACPLIHAPFRNTGSSARICKPRPLMIIWYATVGRYWLTEVSFQTNDSAFIYIV